MPTYHSSTPSARPDHVLAGDYLVEVIDATETVSKSGHEMIELNLRTGAGSYLYDFLVFTPSAFWKIDAFRAATGEIVSADESVEITADDLIGRRGRARLSVEEFNGRKRNKVAAWLAPQPGAQPAPSAQPINHKIQPEITDDNDNIPF